MLSDDALNLARRHAARELEDLRREFRAVIGKEEAGHAARGMSASSMMVSAAREGARRSLEARALMAQRVFSRVMDVDHAEPTDEARAQCLELVRDVIETQSADVDAPLQKAENLLRVGTSRGLAAERSAAIAYAELELDTDLLARRRKLTPLKMALRAPRYAAALEHVVKSESYAAGQNPDFPNAIKESVHALESLARSVAPGAPTTLGDAVKRLRSLKVLDAGVERIIEGIWVYANEEPGVRHGSPTSPNATEQDWQTVTALTESAMRLLLDADSRAPG